MISLTLAACDPYEPTMRPDYAIRVTPAPQQGGMSIATPPSCPSWATATTDPFDNQPFPQYGCSQARNLAGMIENPDDLIQGRDLGNERGATAVGAIRRYDHNQPRGLVWTGADSNQVAVTTAPAAASALSGDAAGGASSSPAAGSASPP